MINKSSQISKDKKEVMANIMNRVRCMYHSLGCMTKSNQNFICANFSMKTKIMVFYRIVFELIIG